MRIPRIPRIPRILALGAAAILALSLPAAAQQPVHHDGLGSLYFPTSGAPEAQADFQRGVLLMHSFEYEEAAAAFRAAQVKDPGFAMAYWGEAMSHNHPVWDEHDRDAARAVLARYAPTPAERAARAPTPRERMYMQAVDVLYGDGPKAVRDTLYGREMEALAEAYPDDDEARAFYALSILGLSRGDRDVPSYMRAGAVALDLFQRNPDHPGAAHYVIHSFDDPTHAPLGLAAAEAYSEIAPSAAHAQHMTTHIFLALGMWDRVVENNERADAVVDAGRAERGMPPTSCGHYNQWLAYGYQQQGRRSDAAALVQACLQQAAGSGGMGFGAESMRAMYVASLDRVEGPLVDAVLTRAAGTPQGPMAGAALLQDWTAGYAAARQGRADEARRHMAAFEAGLTNLEGVDGYVAPYAPMWRGTLRSAVAAAAGDLAGAVREAHAAAEAEAALPVDFGPPLAFKPARELEAEMLLRAGRPDEALSAFRMALDRTPRRALALMGFARAAEAAGEAALAAEAWAELAEITVGEGTPPRER